MQAQDTTANWLKRAEEATEEALMALHDPGAASDEIMGPLSLAMDCMRADCGELKAGDLLALEDHFVSDDDESDCTCPPALRERGGWQSTCPVCGRWGVRWPRK